MAFSAENRIRPETAAVGDLRAADLAVYVHWPFCKSKCPYCDFNSHVRENIAQDEWKDAYLRELRFYREKTGPRRLASVFFGGGTPSLMETATTAAVIEEIDALWGLPAKTEVTLEANPTSVEADKLKDFRSAGINRVSLGVQALNDGDLKKLGRQHSAAEALAAVKIASLIFDRYSFDLIYAREGQSAPQWRRELRTALARAGDHLSLYQLTIEEGTAFHTLHQRGALTIPDEDSAAELYETTQEMMEAAGMPAYEISNHARPGQESQHNLVYWNYGDYAGIGTGAHGRLTLEQEKWGTRAHRAPELWLQAVHQKGNGSHPFENINISARATEKIMMGLRLTKGMFLDDFQQETKIPLLEFLNPKCLKILVDGGLLEQDRNFLRATGAGRQKLNAVLGFLLSPQTMQWCAS